jgi:hypothetical protein
MSKINGLAIRVGGAGEGRAGRSVPPRIGGQVAVAYQILGDIFGRLRDILRVTQYQYDRIPFRNWERSTTAPDPGA